MNIIDNFKVNYACQFDLMDVFKLANDVETRKNSLNQHQIKLEEHIKWFENKIVSKDCIFYIIRTVHNEFIGYIRFDRDISLDLNGKKFIISLSLAEQFRGKGIGAILISHCSSLVLKTFVGSKIVAFIKQDNEASLKCFLKSGFTLIGQEFCKKFYCYKLEFS